MSVMWKVLVVDDDEPVRTSLVNFLEDEGFGPIPAADGEEAVALVRGQSFDGAIVDIRLPGMDGDAVIAESHKIQPGMHFLVYTGSDDYFPSGRLQEMGLSPENVFYKPLSNLSVLSQAMRRLLGRTPS